MEPARRSHGAAVLSDAALDAAILVALAPAGLGERVRVRIGGGYTALQVWERLAGGARDALADGADPVAVRRALDRVHRRLVALAEGGRVRRARARMTVSLNTKGPRDVVVDVFRLG